MSYIAPNSTIKLLANIPLDNSYTNTLWFDSLADQESYFHGTSTVIAVLSNQYYQRSSRDSLKVQVPIGDCYRCKYLAFKNTSFENKWFYAFVTNVEYVNNEVTEIFYEVDVMQTYQHDVRWNSCFVEREHCNPSEDTLGSHILPEPVSINDYLYDGYSKIIDCSDCDILVLVNDSESPHNNGVVFGNNYYGCDMYVYGSASAVNSLLSQYLSKPESVLGIYMIPKGCVANYGQVSLGTDLTPETISFTLTNAFTFDGYSPKNNKLFSYPYCGILLADSSGNSKIYRREFFLDWMQSSGRFNFGVTLNPLPPASVSVFPTGYKDSNGYVVGDGITLSGFPEGCFTYDSASVYAYRQALNMPITFATGAITAGVAGSALALAPVTGGLSVVGAVGIAAVGMVANAIKGGYDAMHKADYMGGTTESNSNAFATGTAGIYMANARITGEEARTIDNFFSIYGYQTNKVKVPNYNGRAVFNYVKTMGETFEPFITGSVNSADVEKMNSILNNGITFWHDHGPSVVGNYTDEILTANMQGV